MTDDQLTLRRTVACASGLIYWAGVMVQARRVRKQIGRSPNVKPKGAREKALWVGWFLVILAWIGQGLLVGRDGTWPGLALWQLPLHPLGLLAGLLLVVLGYAGTLWTYAAMGRSWRMGVNSKEKTELVRSGPFRWSRNPIYGLQIVMLAGVALLLPTAISLAALLLHFTCTLIKIADEEKYLARVHGPAYLEYSATTARLFPRPQPRRPGGGGKPSTCN